MAPLISNCASEPRPIGSPPQAYDAVERFLAEVDARKVLDCPAGQGAFSRRLHSAGFDVTCCDFQPGQFRATELTCDFCDLNSGVPYDDARFDAVVCLNGLHRIWARGRALSEFGRVLRPSGWVLITVPNATNLLRRLSYLTIGVSVPNTVGPPDAFGPEAEDPAGHVRLPLTIAEIARTCAATGLRVEHVRSLVLSRKSVLLAPLAFVAWTFAAYVRRRLGVDDCPPVNSWTGLLSERVLITARKVDGDR